MPTRRDIVGGAALTLGSAIITSPGAAETADPLARIEASGKILQRFGKATDADIDAYEKTYGTRLSGSYRAFLKRENGLRYDITGNPDDMEGGLGALADMNTFFGIGNGDPDNDLVLLTPRMGFWDRRFVPFAPVIGLGGDFCTYAEINGGKYSGQIMYTDGEVYSGFKDAPIEGTSVDELVESFIKAGWFAPVASSFDALLADYAKMV